MSASGRSRASEEQPRKRTKWDPDDNAATAALPATTAEELPEWLQDMASAQLAGKPTQGMGGPAGPGTMSSGSMWLSKELPPTVSPPHLAGLPVLGGSQEAYKRVQVPGSIVGALIGKGGESLDRIRKAAGSDIKLHHGEGEPFGIITIHGNVALAEKIVKERIDEILQIRRSEHFETSYVDVPQELVGQVIGASGCNIQIMQSKCDCKIGFINIKEIDENATEDRQICRIRGPADKITKAREIVWDQVEAVKQFRMKKQKDEIMAKGDHVGGGTGPIDPRAIALRALEAGKAGKGSKARLIANAQRRMGVDSEGKGCGGSMATPNDAAASAVDDGAPRRPEFGGLGASAWLSGSVAGFGLGKGKPSLF